MTDAARIMPSRPAMSLRALAAGIGRLHDERRGDVEVRGISDDSRRVGVGEAYLCLPRASEKARAYIAQAAERGASCVIAVTGDGARDMRPAAGALPYLALPDMAAAGAMLRRWFGTEQGRARLFGITGTDGKTSVAWMLRESLQRARGKAWSIGTLGWVREDGTIRELGNTTPSLLTLHALLANAEMQGVETVVCEVSSHGIVQQRIAGLPFSGAAWITLGHDHLQDHGGFEAYAGIKQSFVSQVADAGGAVVGNADDEGVRSRLPAHAVCFGRGLHREDVALAWEQELPGMLRLRWRGADEMVIQDVPPADFHAANMACVALLLLQTGVSVRQLPELLAGVAAPPGRMQPVHAGRWQVFVDYAHTPEALGSALHAARRFASRRLIVVFGCGGERDRAKRPKMGEVAVRLADVVWLTSDNPRGELPEVIASEVESGMPRPYPAEVHLELDRQAAIEGAVASMTPGDVVLIAGKGHESYMEIGGKRMPWSDTAVAEQALHVKPLVSGFVATEREWMRREWTQRTMAGQPACT